MSKSEKSIFANVLEKAVEYKKYVKIWVDVADIDFISEPKFDFLPISHLNHISELTITYDYGRFGAMGPFRRKLVACFP